MKRARILLADDHTLLMEALTKLLEPEFEVVGMAPDGNALLKAAADLKPDIVVLDVSLPALNGLEAGCRLKKALPSIRLIYLTMNREPDVVAEAFRIGAHGYVLKNSPAAELLSAIQAALRGCLFLTPSANRSTIDSFLQSDDRQKDSARLTLRQREVLQLLAEGRSMKQVAFVLEITPRTVAYHKYRMMEDFNLHSTAALVRFAVSTHVA